MALIVPIVIRCIDYLAYGTIFTRAKKSLNKQVDVFLQESRRCQPGGCALDMKESFFQPNFRVTIR